MCLPCSWDWASHWVRIPDPAPLMNRKHLLTRLCSTVDGVETAGR